MADSENLDSVDELGVIPIDAALVRMIQWVTGKNKLLKPTRRDNYDDIEMII